jgi:crossover junction endodeoxyribonuclease RusA
MIISARGREYKKQTIDLLKNQYEGFTPITGKIKLEIDIYWKDKRKRDIDNAAKSLLDCMKGLLFDDDDQVYELMRKYIGCPENKTVIELTEME